MLACPNESEVDVFKCYDNGWAVLKEQSKLMKNVS